MSKLEKKLQWLVDFLSGQSQLSRFKREVHWVASGRININIPKNTPQYRKLVVVLAKRGLRHPVKHLQLQ